MQLLKENIKSASNDSFQRVPDALLWGIIVEEVRWPSHFCPLLSIMSATILIVEDNSNIRMAMSTFLKMKGYEVREAGNCEEARSQMAKGGIMVTITDLNLPDGKGNELVGQASHPVIAMTGHVDDATRARIVEQGFAGFLPKPASFEQVTEAIESVVKTVL